MIIAKKIINNTITDFNLLNLNMPSNILISKLFLISLLIFKKSISNKL